MNGACEGSMACACRRADHKLKLVVLTGGPGAGKTAVLEMAKRSLCQHVSVLPEAASIVFGGGFLRKESLPARKAAQRAIYYMQRELERLIDDEHESAIALCDRGTLDGLAYWPEAEEAFWREINTTREIEIAKYAAVIHLRTPALDHGYNHSNPVRKESAIQAAEIDSRIVTAWNGHPRRYFIESSSDFVSKASQALSLIREELPDCCKKHALTPNV